MAWASAPLVAALPTKPRLIARAGPESGQGETCRETIMTQKAPPFSCPEPPY